MKHGLNIQNRISGQFYITLDPQNRFYPFEAWVVFQQGDGTAEGDTIQRGLFWTREDAEKFLNTFPTTKENWDIK